MNHLVEFGVKGFRAGKTLFPDWAAYVVGMCRENGYNQQKALPELKSLYAQLLASPATFGFSAYSVKEESTLAEIRHFDLRMLPVFDASFFNEMVNALLDICIEEGRVQYITIQEAQALLISVFAVDFHADIRNCIKSVYAALSYHPGSKLFLVSSIEEVDAYNPFTPHHFDEDDKSILLWVQRLLSQFKGMNEYNSMDCSFADCCGRFGAFIDDLLAGRLENECSFELEVTPNEGADNYSLSLRLADNMFEFSLNASGIDNADERYSESILHWYVDTDYKADENSTKIDMLSEYEYWFVNVHSETRIIASFSAGDDESYVFANRPKQLDFIRHGKEDNN
jgi:hypothetical protein